MALWISALRSGTSIRSPACALRRVVLEKPGAFKAVTPVTIRSACSAASWTPAARGTLPVNRIDPAKRPLAPHAPMAQRNDVEPARWQPSWLLRQHLTAFLLAVLMPVLVREVVGPVRSYDSGLLAFVAMVPGAGLGLAAVGLYLWWTYDAWKHADGTSQPPAWTLGEGAYGLTRNPCNLSIVAILMSQLLWLPSIALALFVVAVCAGLQARVVLVEEVQLAQRHGAQFDEYCERVPRWLPWRELAMFARELFTTLVAMIRNR